MENTTNLINADQEKKEAAKNLPDYKGVPIRALAFIADNILLFMIFPLFHYLAFGEFFRHVSEFSLSFATHPVCLAFLAFYFAYFIVLEGVWGATLGKKLFRIKVARENGQACAFRQSLARNLLRVIDGLFFYLVGIALVATSGKKQRFGDRVARTVVVSR